MREAFLFSMSDLETILAVVAAAVAAAVVISLLKRASRKRGYGDPYRRDAERRAADGRQEDR